MGADSFGIFFDILIAVLLAVVIGYAFLLNRKLTILRDGKADMERLVGELGTSLSKAEMTLANLKEAAAAKSGNLREQLDRADSLADDLAFLVRKSDIAAQKLQLATSRNRNPMAQDPVIRQARPAARPAQENPLGKEMAHKPAMASDSAEAPIGARPLEEKLRAARAAQSDSGGAGAPRGDISEEETALIKVLQGMR